ncbi:extracellular solute-binding protein [Sinorhizobium fredii]|uniref:extracellular solute-binding protein n=1 Tax=Rhizobium fredii TaxID=380 RepID=UPI0006859A86|nr:extracellular solute-binding protein [Sinorhizobium fredii]
MKSVGAISKAIIGALVVLAFLYSSSAYSRETIRVSAQGGSYDVCVKNVYFDAWEKETGIKVEVTSPSYDLGVWRTQQETGKPDWDVATADVGLLHELVKNEWVLPLDRELITRDGGMIDLPSLIPEIDGKIYALPSELFATVVTYNSKTYATETPKTWADVFDTTKFPGKRMFSNMVVDFGVLELALLADGVAPKDLYPLDVDRALKKLDAIKSDILWYDFGTQQVALLQQGDAVIGAGWDGRVKALQRDGGTVEYSPTQAIVKPDLWVLPKGGNSEVGAKFLSFIDNPERQAKFATCVGYGPVLRKAYDFLPADQKFTVDPKNTEGFVVWNAEYWAKNAREVTARFNEWLTR